MNDDSNTPQERIELWRGEHPIGRLKHYRCEGMMSMVMAYFVTRPAQEMVSVSASLKCEKCGIVAELGTHDFGSLFEVEQT